MSAILSGELERLCREARAAAKLTQREQDLEDVTGEYEDALGDIFRSQGALFVDGLKQFRGRFSEADNPPSPLGNDWERVWNQVTDQTDPAMQEELAAAASIALELGGEASIASIGLNLAWDLTNPRVIAYLEQAGELIRNVSDETRQRIGTVIRDGAKAHLSYDELARQITELFDYMAEGAPQAHIASRAHLIAVTELGNAYEEANLIVGRELQDAGFPMIKEWHNRGDSRVSDGCIENGNAGVIKLDSLWPSTEGTYDRQRPLRFPGCRCYMTTEVDPKYLQKAIDRYGLR